MQSKSGQNKFDFKKIFRRFSQSVRQIRGVLALMLVFGIFAFTMSPEAGSVESGNADGESWKLIRKDPLYAPCGPGLSPIEIIELGMLKNVPVTAREQMAAGNAVKQEMAKQGFSSNQPQIRRLQSILGRLLQQNSKSELTYEISLLQSSEINAFTAGGKIFVTTGMMEFILNDDELAGVVGHEIMHNELSHIKKQIQRAKLAQRLFGNELGNLVVVTGQILGASFNQPDEIDADLHGLDLSIKAGFNPCRMIDMWTRMKRMEGQHSELDGLFRTHPFSEDRADCIRQHLDNNYNRSCK